ncbi:MAG TPA: hypothetical protein VHV51_23895, partial [Polyangiaceae bacterium]|nr:hypothetical protein [Polyangiaceae bacterium]
MKLARVALLSAASLLVFDIGCSSSDDSSSNSNADAGPAGGPISGPQDDHCSNVPHITADPAACTADTSEGGAADTGDDSAGGAPSDCNQTHDAEYGDTLYNSDGNDDDCKYHASWTSTPIHLNEPVTFTLTTSLIDDPSTPLAPLADGITPLQ